MRYNGSMPSRDYFKGKRIAVIAQQAAPGFAIPRLDDFNVHADRGRANPSHGQAVAIG